MKINEQIVIGHRKPPVVEWLMGRIAWTEELLFCLCFCNRSISLFHFIVVWVSDVAKEDYVLTDTYDYRAQEGASRRRREDALALYNARRWNGAIYLGGYAIECSLKSLIC